MAVYTVFGQTGGSAVDSGTTAFTAAMEFSLSQSASWTGIWFYSPPSAALLPFKCGMFRVSDQSTIVENDSPAWSGIAGSGWVRCAFDGSVTLLAATNYLVAVCGNGGGTWEAFDANYWSSGAGGSGIISGIITAPNNATASLTVPGQCCTHSNNSFTYPNEEFESANYWVDVEVTTSPGPATTDGPAGDGGTVAALIAAGVIR